MGLKERWTEDGLPVVSTDTVWAMLKDFCDLGIFKESVMHNAVLDLEELKKIEHILDNLYAQMVKENPILDTLAYKGQSFNINVTGMPPGLKECLESSIGLYSKLLIVSIYQSLKKQAQSNKLENQFY